MGKNFLIVIFWPLARAKCHSRWCTGRKWHIPMAVMWGNRVGGNWLMKWDELKKFLWYTHRLMHRKRVTCELHDSYFHLMTIKHAISKIEWALNHYITQLSSTSQWSCQESSRQLERDVVGKATPDRGALGNPDGVWGPEKMLIRCCEESQHPAAWALGLRLSSPREKERHNVTVITVRSKYFSYVRSPAPSYTQTLSNPFVPLQIKSEVNIFVKKSSCVLIIASVFIIASVVHCVGMYPAYICIFLHGHVYVYISIFIMWVYNIILLKKWLNFL